MNTEDNRNKDPLDDSISNMDALRGFNCEKLNTSEGYKLLLLLSIARSLACIADKMNETK